MGLFAAPMPGWDVGRLEKRERLAGTGCCQDRQMFRFTARHQRKLRKNPTMSNIAQLDLGPENRLLQPCCASCSMLRMPQRESSGTVEQWSSRAGEQENRVLKRRRFAI